MIIYHYLFKRFIIGVAVSLTVLVSIETFFSFTAELKYLNIENYTIVTIIKYIILSLPKSVEIMYPYAVLIGSMLSFGAMASDMEFVSMQAAGISVTKIISIVIIQAFLLSTIFYYISDSIVPKYTIKAEKKKNLALNKKIIFTQNGVWFKDKNTFIKVNEVYSEDNLAGITLYSYDDNKNLKSIKSISEARYINSQWKLFNLKETFINENPIINKSMQVKIVDHFIDKNLVTIKTHNPSSLSFSDVTKNIDYLTTNNLDASIQKKIYWEKIFKPISTIIMLFLSMPFIFGRHRSTNTSKRLVLGLFIGIAFFIVSSIVPNLGMVFGVMPFVSVLLPNIIFIIVGKHLLDYHLEAGLR